MVTKPAKTSKKLEAHLERQVSNLGIESSEIRELTKEALRADLLDNVDPLNVLKRRLIERYEQPDGSLEIPEDQLEDRAIHLLIKKFYGASSALEMILVRKLSCDHEVLYASSMKTEENRIFTAVEVARHGLEDLKYHKL